MSGATPESNQPKTQKEIDQIRTDALSEYLNPYAGDIYRSALICFDRFTVLRQANLRIDPASNYLSGGLNGDGEPEIFIGTEQSAITPRVKSRISERFGLPETEDMPDAIYQLFVLAHEIGHVIQKDPQFKSFYGEYDDTALNPKDDYEEYVNSDNEVLADFIATQIISNSILGKAMGMMPPAEEPHQWREWGQNNRVDETIRLYGNEDYPIIHPLAEL